VKATRRVIQAAFLALTVIGVYLVGGHAERWCPFGGVEALYGYLAEGNLICSLGISNLYILLAVLVMTLLLRRAFCGYMCPVGALSEWVQRGAQRLGIRPLSVPRPLDRALSLLKYVVLAVVLYFTWRTGELVLRGYDPCYALISRHGEDITVWAYVVSGAIVAASIMLTVPFCRWLCPLAATLNPFSRFGLARVRRQAEACLDCGHCARECPMAIPVDEVEQVTAARCISCLNCVSVCPRSEPGAPALVWGPPGRHPRAWSQAVLLVVLLACIGGAVAASALIALPSFVSARGEPSAHTETVDLKITGLTCRGRATLLLYFLERDDEFALPGYVRVEAWPGPDPAVARVTFDPAVTTAEAVRQAISAPYFDHTGNLWRMPPFALEGYDPFGLAP